MCESVLQEYRQHRIRISADETEIGHITGQQERLLERLRPLSKRLSDKKARLAEFRAQYETVLESVKSLNAVVNKQAKATMRCPRLPLLRVC